MQRISKPDECLFKINVVVCRSHSFLDKLDFITFEFYIRSLVDLANVKMNYVIMFELQYCVVL